MDEAVRCTRLACIAYGHILAQGTSQEIIASAQLATWEVRGSDLMHLAEKLHSLPGIEQVAFFGEALHVSSKNADLLASSIKPFQTNPYRWKEIHPDLEDVFIALVGPKKEPVNAR